MTTAAGGYDAIGGGGGGDSGSDSGGSSVRRRPIKMENRSGLRDDETRVLRQWWWRWRQQVLRCWGLIEPESAITCDNVLFLEHVDGFCNTFPLLVGVVVMDWGPHQEIVDRERESW